MNFGVWVAYYEIYVIEVVLVIFFQIAGFGVFLPEMIVVKWFFGEVDWCDATEADVFEPADDAETKVIKSYRAYACPDYDQSWNYFKLDYKKNLIF